MLDEKINEKMLVYQTGSGSEINKRPTAIKSSLTLGGLDQIKSPHIDLVIWHRTLPDHFRIGSNVFRRQIFHKFEFLWHQMP